jgi:hypothetical protein
MRSGYDDFVSTKKEMDGLFGAWRTGSRRFDEMFVDLWKKRIRSMGAGSSGAQALKNLQARHNHKTTHTHTVTHRCIAQHSAT